MEADSGLVRATYLIASPQPPTEVAEFMAMEGSVGLPGLGADWDGGAHRARVLSCEECEVPTGLLPSAGLAGAAGRVRAARATIGFPAANIGASLPQLLSTVAGEVFDTGTACAVRLVDLELPRWLPGPRFGPPEQVMLGAILKPSNALSPDESASLARELAAGGIDLVKDDESMASPRHSPVVERVRAIRRAAPGVLYMANVTGPLDTLLDRAYACADEGANGLMLSWATSGVDALRWLREEGPELPVHAHPNFAAAFERCPALGVAPVVVARLTVASGGDQVHAGSVAGRLWGPPEEVIELASAIRSAGACPVVAGGESPATVEPTAEALGRAGYLHLCGAGVVGHPDGPTAGAIALRRAWDRLPAGPGLDQSGGGPEG